MVTHTAASLWFFQNKGLHLISAEKTDAGQDDSKDIVKWDLPPYDPQQRGTQNTHKPGRLLSSDNLDILILLPKHKAFLILLGNQPLWKLCSFILLQIP